MDQNTHFMTVSQVARRLSLSAERVRQLARSGKLPPDQVTELGRLWLPETVERFALTRGRWGRYDTAVQEDKSAEPPSDASGRGGGS